MLTDKQKAFLDNLEEPEWTVQWMAERLAAGEERLTIKNGRQLTFKGKDIESAIRYLSPRLSDWLDSRDSLKR
jgi:hypothetical protein